jgi:hypothetical protein
MNYLLSPIVDSRPLEPDWVNDTSQDEFSLDWVATYTVWNKEIKAYDRPEDCGSTVDGLYKAVVEALVNQKTCTFRVTIQGHDSTYLNSDFASINPPDNTYVYWRIYNASDEGFYSQCEEGLDNSELLWLLLDNISNPDVLLGDDIFVIEISPHDPTP